MARKIKHEDFGEKIGGVKKDLWRERGLIASDLTSMNEREADKYVKKDNIWKPNYEAMIDGGIPVDVAYYIKSVRDSLPASPVFIWEDRSSEKRLARQAEYIDTVREVRNAMDGVRTKVDVMAAFDRFFIDGGYIERIGNSQRLSWTVKGKDNPAITEKLLYAMHISSEGAYLHDVIKKAEQQQFGVSKEEKVPRGYEIRFFDGKNAYSRNDDWMPNTYFVLKNHSILEKNFATKTEALSWMQDYAKQRGKSGKKRYVPEQLMHVRREGLPNYRRGRDVKGQDYLDTFGFKGGEFGNWVNQNERQVSLNMGFDALMDLAAALKISCRDISYQGALSIAFGARGSGNAVAHYEPLRHVINLTKMKGAGSLAHEWWHGLDDYLGTKLGLKGMLSENPRKHPLFEKLIHTIKYKSETTEQAAVRAKARDAQTRRSAERYLEMDVGNVLKRNGDDKIHAVYETLKTTFLSGEPGTVDKLNELNKSMTGRIIPKEARDRLLTYEKILHTMGESPEPTIGQVMTDFYRNSKRMGEINEKDGDYWDSNTEMTARAFATYVMDSLAGRSDYLAGHAQCAVAQVTDKAGNTAMLKSYPEGEERKAINAVFDEIVAELKKEKYLTHNEHAQPDPILPLQVSPLDAPIVEESFGRRQPGQHLSFSRLLGAEKERAIRPSVMDKLDAAKKSNEKACPKSPSGISDERLKRSNLLSMESL